MKECLNQKQNLENCSCSYSGCSRKAICCECVLYHRSRGQIPGCFFSTDIERTYDRSVENFIKNESGK